MASSSDKTVEKDPLEPPPSNSSSKALPAVHQPRGQESSYNVLEDNLPRYAGYAASIARVAKAFSKTVAKTAGKSMGKSVTKMVGKTVTKSVSKSSDVGDAIKPVADHKLVHFLHILAVSYIVSDIAYDAYEFQQGKRDPERPLSSLSQLVAEKTVFQLVSSLILPHFIVNGSVKITTPLFDRLNRFQKWGPTMVGLSIIPFLPLVLDRPIEDFVAHLFDHYGPWALNSTSSKPKIE